MKITHMLIIALVAIGGLYAWHMFSTHGTFKSGLAGLGVTR